MLWGFAESDSREGGTPRTYLENRQGEADEKTNCERKSPPAENVVPSAHGRGIDNR